MTKFVFVLGRGNSKPGALVRHLGECTGQGVVEAEEDGQKGLDLCGVTNWKSGFAAVLGRMEDGCGLRVCWAKGTDATDEWERC